MPHISVVIPVYKAEACLFELYSRLVRSLETLTHDFEIIMVEDCGGDGSWAIITELARKDSRVKGIQFSRNFGQHYAITAGVDRASGEWVVVMDCDLQDQPEEIPKLYAKALEGYDKVFARRYARKDSFLKKLSSKLFFMVFDYFTESDTDNTVANFGVYSKKVIDNFRKMREQSRSFPLFVKWLGFNVAYVNVEHAERYAGESSYTFSKMMNLAIDTIISLSNKPLKLAIKFGFLLACLSVLFGIYLISKYFFLGVPIMGWTSMMVSLFFIGGLLFANMGLLGLYIGKTYDEVKGRPLYVVSDMLNLSSVSMNDEAVNNENR